MRIATIMAGLWMLGVVAGPLARAAEEAREADHEALRELRVQAVKAINARDTEALMGCFATEFVFTAADQTVLTDRTGVEAFFNRLFNAADAPLAALTADPTATIFTRFTDPNTGYCYGVTKDTYTLKNGRSVIIPACWTAVVVKQNGEWRVAAAHVGVNFLDNPVLTIRALPWWRKLAIFLGLAKWPGQA